MGIEPIDLREIDQNTSNIYEAVIVAAKKARQINNENRLEYNARLGLINNKGLEDDIEDLQNEDQLKISLEFEKKSKPHTQALNDLLKSQIEYRYKP